MAGISLTDIKAEMGYVAAQCVIIAKGFATGKITDPKKRAVRSNPDPSAASKVIPISGEYVYDLIRDLLDAKAVATPLTEEEASIAEMIRTFHRYESEVNIAQAPDIRAKADAKIASYQARVDQMRVKYGVYKEEPAPAEPSLTPPAPATVADVPAPVAA